MERYSTFSFDAYTFNPTFGRIALDYSLRGAEGAGDMHFTEVLTLPIGGMYVHGVPKELLDRALFALHLIGGVSYYKTCVPKTVEVHSGKLTEEQADFWNALYEKGLGQFFFENDIGAFDLINFPTTAADAPDPIPIAQRHDRVLVPIGGGKDSIVTAELIKSSRIDCALLRMGSHPLISETAQVAQLPLICVERTLSPRLFQLNEAGALNGHVPITAYVHALSVIVALLYGFDFVAFSNESSASEGNVRMKGKTINHQWSKGAEFERMFQEYVAKNLTPDLSVFSMLRSMSELTIANIFCRHPKYFPCFTSCNRNWKILEDQPAERWCLQCPKCAFVFLALAAFLPMRNLKEIFGRNLLEDESLIPLYRKLLGLEGFKPFECVGTPEETIAAFILALKRNRQMENTSVMQMFLTEKGAHVDDAGDLIEAVLDVDDNHLIPARFLSKIDAH